MGSLGDRQVVVVEPSAGDESVSADSWSLITAITSVG